MTTPIVLPKDIKHLPEIQRLTKALDDAKEEVKRLITINKLQKEFIFPIESFHPPQMKELIRSQYKRLSCERKSTIDKTNELVRDLKRLRREACQELYEIHKVQFKEFTLPGLVKHPIFDKLSADVCEKIAHLAAGNTTDRAIILERASDREPIAFVLGTPGVESFNIITTFSVTGRFADVGTMFIKEMKSTGIRPTMEICVGEDVSTSLNGALEFIKVLGVEPSEIILKF